MSLTSFEGGSFQQEVLGKFTALWLLRQRWGGCLILSCGLGGEGAALALAANIAGAVCLSVEPDAEVLKAASRSGACDFAVNTLDEALRTMKNELRKAQPLSVGLRGGTTAVLAEILERGLLPMIAADLSLPATDAVSAAMSRLQGMGARIVDFDGRKMVGGSVDAKSLLEQWTLQNGWRLRCLSAEDRTDLTALDDALQKLLTPEDTLRRRWLQRAPLHFRRERPLCRAVWVSESEGSALRDAGRVLSAQSHS